MLFSYCSKYNVALVFVFHSLAEFTLTLTIIIISIRIRRDEDEDEDQDQDRNLFISQLCWGFSPEVWGRLKTKHET